MVAFPKPDYKVHRRVAGYHDVRLDGMSDLLLRCRDCTILDIGCNRGLVGLEFAQNGAALVHGLDNYEPGIKTAREVFADLRSVISCFEVHDLTTPLPDWLLPRYSIVVVLATFHKLKRKMRPEAFMNLVRQLGIMTAAYFAWRATSDKPGENEEEMQILDTFLAGVGLKRIQTSVISDELGLCAIWRRVE